jgi:hypothetical protein
LGNLYVGFDRLQKELVTYKGNKKLALKSVADNDLVEAKEQKGENHGKSSSTE